MKYVALIYSFLFFFFFEKFALIYSVGNNLRVSRPINVYRRQLVKAIQVDPETVYTPHIKVTFCLPISTSGPVLPWKFNKASAKLQYKHPWEV